MKLTRELLEVLRRAQRLGLIGKNADLSVEIAHSLKFGEIAFGQLLGGETKCWDMGSGGGLPAFPLCLKWPESIWMLSDASEKKCNFLEWGIAKLKINASVFRGQIRQALPQSYDLVTARAFGAPRVVAENATGLLRKGGYLLVSNPPSGKVWPANVLEQHGLELCESKEISVLQKIVSHETSRTA